MSGISRARRSFYLDPTGVLLTVAKGGEAALCLRHCDRAGRGEMAPVSPWTWISGDIRMDGLLGLERCWWCAVGGR
jgi:hypothetical protein